MLRRLPHTTTGNRDLRSVDDSASLGASGILAPAGPLETGIPGINSYAVLVHQNTAAPAPLVDLRPNAAALLISD